MSEAQQTGQPTGPATGPAAGQGGRYQRSTGGLIGSMIVLVLIVLGIVVFRGTFRNTPSYEPDHLDYLSLVTSVQQAGVKPAYPAQLPDGWYVKDASFTPGDGRPVLDLAMTTDDDLYAGLHEEDESADALVHKYIGGDATRGDDVQVTGSVAPTWQTYSAPDGDHAFTAELGHQTVLVYGSASEDDLRGVVESLTTARLDPKLAG